MPKTRQDLDEENEARRILRRHLYRVDPIWRLTKNKDNRERRLRKRLKENDR